MRVSGPSGARAQLEFSMDLEAWIKLGEPVTLGTEPVPLSDPETSQPSYRFYRAVLLPFTLSN